jgi:hypothetical protein
MGRSARRGRGVANCGKELAAQGHIRKQSTTAMAANPGWRLPKRGLLSFPMSFCRPPVIDPGWRVRPDGFCGDGCGGPV